MKKWAGDKIWQWSHLFWDSLCISHETNSRFQSILFLLSQQKHDRRFQFFADHSTNVTKPRLFSELLEKLQLFHIPPIELQSRKFFCASYFQRFPEDVKESFEYPLEYKKIKYYITKFTIDSVSLLFTINGLMIMNDKWFFFLLKFSFKL